MKDPNFILGQTYVSNDESLRKCRKCAKPAVRPQKFATQINTRDLVNLNKHLRVVQWVESLGETLMTGFHT